MTNTGFSSDLSYFLYKDTCETAVHPDKATTLAFTTDYFLYFTLSSLQTHPVAAFMLAPKVVTLVSCQLENFNCFSAYKSTLTVAAPFFDI